MRRVFVPLLALLAAPGFSQAPPPDELLIQSEMSALATSPAIYLDLIGTDQTDTHAPVGYEYRVYMEAKVVGTRVYDTINITKFDGSGFFAKPVMSLIGDGITLWRYDYVNNTYAATDYGTYSGPQPADYTGTLFRDLGSLSDGYSAFVIQFLKQTYLVSGGAYHSWMPGVTPTIDASNSVTYSIGTPPRRTINFKNVGGVLAEVDYDDVSTVRGVQRRVDWAMTVQALSTTDPLLYNFKPPLGAKAIALPHLGH